MATNSSIFSGSTYAKYQVLHLVFNQVSQDVANNRTLFSYEAYIQGTGGGSGSTYAGSYSITGATTTSASGQSWSWTSTKKQTIATGSFYVSHNSDGTLGTQTLNVSANVVTTSATLTASTSVSLTVPTIPRASQPTLNVSTQALGSSITISTNRASTSFTHTLTYAFGNQSGTIATGVTTSQAWTLPLGLASAIPNATSGVGTITCKTFNGSTEIGSKSVSFTATVPNIATFQPTASISSIVENGDVPSWMTVFVQNKTKVKVTSSGNGKYSSTVKTYSVSVANIGTYTGSVITSDFLKNSGTVRVTLTVTDSRGLKGSTYQDINVVAYSPPQIPTFNARRSESTPTNIVISHNASISSVSNQNSVVYQIRTLASGGSWVVNKNVTTGYSFSGSFAITSDSDKSYTVEIYVQDSFTSVTQTVQVGTAFTLIDFNASGKGMAIGKVSESDTFEVGMPTTIFTTAHDVLKLKRTSLYANVNLVFENDTQTRYLTFKGSGRPAWHNTPEVDALGYDFWTSENSNAMVNSGTDANGTYIRFSDGTQICYGTATYTGPCNLPIGSSYRTNNVPQPTPPAVFTGEYARYFSIIPFSGGTDAVIFSIMLQSKAERLDIYTPLSHSTITFKFGYQYIGRWK